MMTHVCMIYTYIYDIYYKHTQHICRHGPKFRLLAGSLAGLKHGWRLRGDCPQNLRSSEFWAVSKTRSFENLVHGIFFLRPVPKLGTKSPPMDLRQTDDVTRY